MASRGHWSRRRFLGATAALAAGGALGARSASAPPSLRWGQLEGVPDGPLPLLLEGVDQPAGSKLLVRLEVQTPRGRMELEGPPLVVDGQGRAEAEARLPWPCGDHFVVGRFAYHARVELGPGRVLRTAAPAGYLVRPLAWHA